MRFSKRPECVCQRPPLSNGAPRSSTSSCPGFFEFIGIRNRHQEMCAWAASEIPDPVEVSSGLESHPKTATSCWGLGARMAGPAKFRILLASSFISDSTYSRAKFPKFCSFLRILAPPSDLWNLFPCPLTDTYCPLWCVLGCFPLLRTPESFTSHRTWQCFFRPRLPDGVWKLWVLLITHPLQHLCQAFFKVSSPPGEPPVFFLKMPFIFRSF